MSKSLKYKPEMDEKSEISMVKKRSGGGRKRSGAKHKEKAHKVPWTYINGKKHYLTVQPYKQKRTPASSKTYCKKPNGFRRVGTKIFPVCDDKPRVKRSQL